MLAHRNTSGQTTKMAVLTGILLCVFFVVAAALAEESPLFVHLGEASPGALPGPGTVWVSINISNRGDGVVTVELREPNGNACAAFGVDGAAELSPEQLISYEGSWTVSQQELDAGKIIYSMNFAFQDAAGMPASGSLPIAIGIEKSGAVAELDILRVSPTPMNGETTPGQTVVLAYQFKNTGAVDLLDIAMTDANIIDETITLSRLKPGEVQELSYSYTADASSKISRPTITFQYDGGGIPRTESVTGVPFALNVAASGAQSPPETGESAMGGRAFENCKVFLALCTSLLLVNGWKGGVR